MNYPRQSSSSGERVNLLLMWFVHPAITSSHYEHSPYVPSYFYSGSCQRRVLTPLNSLTLSSELTLQWIISNAARCWLMSKSQYLFPCQATRLLPCDWDVIMLYSMAVGRPTWILQFSLVTSIDVLLISWVYFYSELTRACYLFSFWLQFSVSLKAVHDQRHSRCLFS